MFGLPNHLAREQLGKLRSDARLIVLHPDYIPQHLVFAELLNKGVQAYVRFDGRDLSLNDLDQQLDTALAEQNGQGRLGGIDYLILDECDCARAADLATFVTSLLGQFDGGTVVMATRQPPYTLLAADHLRAQMQFLPVDESLMLWDYARREVKPDAGQVLLEVRALGNGRVLMDGKAVDNWDGLLPRSLFFYLVDKGMTTRNDIFATFWPTLSVREATNVFHVTKRKISEVLGIDLTEYWSGFYHISPQIELSYDVVRFSELFQDSAVASLDSMIDLLRRSISMYRDDFLTSLEMNWVHNRRRELRQTYGEALIGLGKALEQRGSLDEALGLYLRATITSPHREDVALSAMKLYQSMTLPDDALLVYNRLKSELNESLGVAPNHQLQELAGELERSASTVRR